jgi:hypothetical protein
MEFLTNSIWGGLITILLGILFIGMAIIPKEGRGLTTGNIKLVMSGSGLIILGIISIVQSFE